MVNESSLNNSGCTERLRDLPDVTKRVNDLAGTGIQAT